MSNTTRRSNAVDFLFWLTILSAARISCAARLEGRLKVRPAVFRRPRPAFTAGLAI
ncbi:hypothetical protein HMPREF9120_01000 [Neisseria sp. oral taxon 020 str. F0370]|nr:hypothetical protein HMPREF9120_01000 [Neisseria sp. oral taxon 020 str. F0370]